MKNFILFLILFTSIGVSAQKEDCSRLWLGDTYDFIDVIKQITGEYLQTNFKLLPNEGSKTIYELGDPDNLSHIKIWMKGKRIVSGGNVTTTYVLSSYKIIGPAEKIESLFKAWKEKVGKCSAETSPTSITFGLGKMFTENHGGEWDRKNIPMSTLTITSN